MRVVHVVGIFALGLASGTALGYWLKKPVEPAATAHAATASVAPVAAQSPAVKSAVKPASKSRGRGRLSLSEEDEQLVASVADPRIWLETWIASDASPENSRIAAALVNRWAEIDVHAALQFVIRAPRFPARNAALIGPLAMLGKQDITAAEHWITTNLVLSDRREIGDSVVQQVGEDNPAAALQLAFAPDIPIDRDIFGGLIGQLARTDSVAALAYFGRLSEQGRTRAAGALVRQWYEVDPAATLRWVQSQHTQPHGRAATAGYLEAVATLTPERLPDSLQQVGASSDDLSFDSFNFFSLSADAKLALLPHLPQEERRLFLSDLVDDEIQRSPELAWKLARESMDEKEAAEIFARAWVSWQSSDRKAAQEWIQTAQDPSMRAALTRSVRLVAATEDPKEFLASLNPAGPDAQDTQLLNRAIVAINNTDSAAAAAWVTKLSTAVSSGVVASVASSWMDDDDVAALQWINTLAVGPQRDAALVGAANHWVNRDDLPKASIAISNISNPEQRTQAQWHAFQRAFGRNREAAAQWLAAQPISQEVKSNWLTILSGRP